MNVNTKFFNFENFPLNFRKFKIIYKGGQDTIEHILILMSNDRVQESVFAIDKVFVKNTTK